MSIETKKAFEDMLFYLVWIIAISSIIGSAIFNLQNQDKHIVVEEYDC